MIVGWKNVLGSLAMIAVLTQVCRAQISPAAGADANSPAGPPAPVSANDIWSVDPVPGNSRGASCLSPGFETVEIESEWTALRIGWQLPEWMRCRQVGSSSPVPKSEGPGAPSG
jgi:hypothetical protein